MKIDIASRTDIVKLVNTFYDKVRNNTVIGHIFNDIAQVDWEHHLPVMYSFWSSILLHEQSYKGNPMIKHILLNDKVKLEQKHFDEWINIFHSTVDELFEGPIADDAKNRAVQIATLMKYKIHKHNEFPK